MLWLTACFLTMTTAMRRSIVDSLRIGGYGGVAGRAGPRMALSSTSSPTISPHAFSVAPMMEYTDRHQRYLTRIMSKHTVLYTEMVTCYALCNNPSTERFLRASIPFEEPLVLQLGGADPTMMAKAAVMGAKYGYKEFNINCGCPSERVAGVDCKYGFGAALMSNPVLVGQIAHAMADATGLPVTVKCRIGVDEADSYEELVRFIDTVSKGNVNHFIIHARKAILGKKFTPADNRKIPPLRYEVVHRLVRDLPHLQFTINGGIMSIDEAVQQINHGVHGVMVGRAVTDKPFHWRHVDSKLFGQADPGLSRREVLDKYIQYAVQEVKEEPRSRRALVKPLHHLFFGEPSAKAYRTRLEQQIADKSMPVDQVIRNAVKVFPEDVMDRFDDDPVPDKLI